MWRMERGFTDKVLTVNGFSTPFAGWSKFHTSNPIPDQCHYFFKVSGFGEYPDYSGLAGQAGDLRRNIAGAHENGDARRDFPDFSGQFKTVHPRHVEVGNHQEEGPLPQFPERL